MPMTDEQRQKLRDVEKRVAPIMHKVIQAEIKVHDLRIELDIALSELQAREEQLKPFEDEKCAIWQEIFASQEAAAQETATQEG